MCLFFNKLFINLSRKWCGSWSIICMLIGSRITWNSREFFQSLRFLIHLKATGSLRMKVGKCVILVHGSCINLFNNWHRWKYTYTYRWLSWHLIWLLSEWIKCGLISADYVMIGKLIKAYHGCLFCIMNRSHCNDIDVGNTCCSWHPWEWDKNLEDLIALLEIGKLKIVTPGC